MGQFKFFHGTVKKCHEDKGFGYITCPEAGAMFNTTSDVWVHAAELKGTVTATRSTTARSKITETISEFGSSKLSLVFSP